MKHIVFALTLLCALVACGNMTPSGDIFAVNTPTSGGLTGGVTTGSANLSLRTDCVGAGAIVKWDGDSWECDTDAGITGTVSNNTLAKGNGAGGLTNASITDDLTTVTINPTVGTTAIVLGVGSDTTAMSGVAGIRIAPDATAALRVDGTGLTNAISATGPAIVTGNTSIATAAGAAVTGWAQIGKAISSTTATDQSLRLTVDSTGSNYIDSKVATSGVTTFRGGAGAETGFARTLIVMDNGTGAISIPGTASLNGTVNLGDAAADVIAITGRATSTYGATGQAANRNALAVVNSASYDATAADRIAFGVNSTVSATRISGSNNVKGIALYGTSTGAQINIGLETGDGANYLNAISGNTCIGCASGAALTAKLTVAGTLDVDNDLSKFGSTTDGGAYFAASSLNFDYATNAGSVGRINAVGFQNGTTQARNLEILDGKGGVIATFAGGSKTTTLSGAFTVFGNSDIGDADTDFVNSRATLAFSGTNPSINSCGGSPSVSGEAQSFQLTVGSGTTSCVVNLNRTFNSAPYCTFSPANTQAASDVASSGSLGDAPRISSTTTTATMTFDGNTEGAPIYNITCFDRR